jgi:hypothetical protein
MNDDSVQVPVTLTREESAKVDAKAQTQGISTEDFLGYCVRTLSFGINYAISMLPKQGQIGTHDQQE